VNDESTFGGKLASLSGRLRGLVEAQAKGHPEARVALARPLDPAPAAKRVDALLGIQPGFIGGPQPRAPWAPEMGAFQGQISGCLACALGAKRRHLVFGEGDVHAALAFVGGAPGGDEDLAGRPFIGAAGQLLDRMVAAMGYKRDEVYLCNALKCRPGGGEAEASHLQACRPYLLHQLDLLRPRAVVALGETAARALLGGAAPLADLRGRWAEAQGLRVMPTFHPADLLRDPGLKRHVWDDLKLVLQELTAP